MCALQADLEPTLVMLTQIEQALETMEIPRDLNFVGVTEPVLQESFFTQTSCGTLHRVRLPAGARCAGSSRESIP